MVDPTRTFVAPAAMACSKSADMPMDSSRLRSSTPSASATALRHTTRHAKFSGRDV